MTVAGMLDGTTEVIIENRTFDKLAVGRADILVVPDLQAGNMLAKSLTFLAGAEAAGAVLDARVPVILASRADGPATIMASCALGVLASRAAKGARA